MYKAKTLIIIPTYNELDNVTKLYKEIKIYASRKDILFVDDSKDATPNVIRDIISSDQSVKLLKRDKKNGLASAYIDGFNWGLNRDYEWFQQIDADLSHDPKYLIEFDKLKNNYDLIIASRYVKNGSPGGWKLSRKILSFLGCKYLKTVLGISINDLTGGFNCFNRKIFEEIDLSSLKSKGNLFFAEIKLKIFKKGFRIIEFPYIFGPRNMGQSKMDLKIIFEALIKAPKIRMDNR